MDQRKLKNKNLKTPEGIDIRSKYKPEYCQALIDHMKKGFSFRSFCSVAEVHLDTLYNWLKLYPDFANAYIVADAHSRTALEAMLLGLASGKLKGSADAAKFIIKNRFPQEFRDKQEIAIEDITQVDDNRLKELAKQALDFLGMTKNDSN